MTMRLQSILLPTEDICNVEALYFHRNGNYLEFDGYFNLFQIAKRKHYTALTGIALQLELSGYSELLLMNDRRTIAWHRLEAATRKAYRFELPYQTSEGVFWFSLKRDETVPESFLQGYFDGICPEPTPVNIVMDICTYRREPYVCRNMERLIQRIYQDPALEVRKHLQAYLVDNSQTLSQCEELQELLQAAKGKIKVFPNQNTGGAGGFTRGMIEALKRKDTERLTHILLMDDDAMFEPDALVRLYGLLSTLKEGYRDVTVGGALWMEEFPFLQHAAGENFDRFRFEIPDVCLDLRKYENCTKDSQLAAANEAARYSGWWFCCYSLNVVSENNLPLPLFLHCDDIEYGLRNAKHGLLFLNGIGVWHKEFDLQLPGINPYFDTRNRLITVALHSQGHHRQMARAYIRHCLLSCLLRYKYQDAELIYQGLIDFCKGPEWLLHMDGINLLKKLQAQAYQAATIESSSLNYTAAEQQEIHRQIQNYQQRFDAGVMCRHFHNPQKPALGKVLSMNGWLLPASSKGVYAVSMLDTPFSTYRKRRIFLFEPTSGKGISLRKSYRSLLHVLKLWLKSEVVISKYLSQTVKSYQEKRMDLSDIKTWGAYLK